MVYFWWPSLPYSTIIIENERDKHNKVVRIATSQVQQQQPNDRLASRRCSDRSSVNRTIKSMQLEIVEAVYFEVVPILNQTNCWYQTRLNNSSDDDDEDDDDDDDDEDDIRY